MTVRLVFLATNSSAFVLIASHISLSFSLKETVIVGLTDEIIIFNSIAQLYKNRRWHKIAQRKNTNHAFLKSKKNFPDKINREFFLPSFNSKNTREAFQLLLQIYHG